MILKYMTYPREKVAGMLFFVAASQFVLCLTIAEALYPGYSIFGNYISDLGVGPSPIVFNSSVFLLGLLLVAGVNLLRYKSNFQTLNIMLLLMVIGSMDVGIFYSLFLCGLSAITSFKVLTKPFSLISITWSNYTGSTVSILNRHGRKRFSNQRGCTWQHLLLGLRSRRNGTHDSLSSTHLDCWVQWTPSCPAWKKLKRLKLSIWRLADF